MSKIEEVEPYTPFNFKKLGTFNGKIWWHCRYRNYQGEYPWNMNVRGDDELAAYMYAVKELAKLKKRADKRREKKEQALLS